MKQHRNRHRSNPARNRTDPPRNLGHTLKIDITNRPKSSILTLDPINPHINHQRPFPHHITRNQPRHTRRRNQHIRRQAQFLKPGSVLIATHHRRFPLHQKHRDWPPNHRRCPHHHAHLALEIYHRRINHLQRRQSRTRCPHRPPIDHIADIGRIHTFDILHRVDQFLNPIRINPFG